MTKTASSGGPVEQTELEMETSAIVSDVPASAIDTIISPSPPITTSPSKATATIPSIFEDQNQNRLKHQLIIDMPTSPTNLANNPQQLTGDQEGECIFENNLKFFPSSHKDLEFMKNIRKVYISLMDGNYELNKDLIIQYLSELFLKLN